MIKCDKIAQKSKFWQKVGFCKKWSTFSRPHDHITHFGELCIFLLIVLISLNKT